MKTNYNKRQTAERTLLMLSLIWMSACGTPKAINSNTASVTPNTTVPEIIDSAEDPNASREGPAPFPVGDFEITGNSSSNTTLSSKTFSVPKSNYSADNKLKIRVRILEATRIDAAQASEFLLNPNNNKYQSYNNTLLHTEAVQLKITLNGKVLKTPILKPNDNAGAVDCQDDDACAFLDFSEKLVQGGIDFTLKVSEVVSGAQCQLFIDQQTTVGNWYFMFYGGYNNPNAAYQTQLQMNTFYNQYCKNLVAQYRTHKVMGDIAIVTDDTAER